MASRRSTAKVSCWQPRGGPRPKPSCSRARCCETAAASSGTTASGSCASWTPPAIRSVPSHSRPIALKGAVTAFLEAMLGVVPRLGVSLALIIAHELSGEREALADLGHELRDFDRFELLSRRAGARFTGGCTRVQESARNPLCRSAQLTE